MEASCATCGKVHKRRPRDLKNSISGLLYCSLPCYHESLRFPLKSCIICGSPTKAKNKTCSRACANKSRAGVIYDKKQSRSRAKTVQTQKADLLRLRGHKCERCHFDRNVQILVVHHIVERRHGGTDDYSNLQLLCPNCHAEIHYG